MSSDHSGSRYALTERLRASICVEDWNIGLVRQSAADIVERGLVGPVQWRSPPPTSQFLADPSCRMRDDGVLILYAECFERTRDLGEIWSAEIGPGDDPLLAPFKPLLREPFHLSYPFPFNDESGAALLTAESWQAGGALLWHEIGGSLKPLGPLLDGHSIVDPTLWRGSDRWWLFCTMEDDHPTANLHLFYTSRIGDPWTAHPCNPVKTARRGARPAGPLFVANGVLVRPGQDCTDTYGGAVILNAVRRLDPAHFEEEEIRRLGPESPYGSGLHTICPAGEITFVDGRRWRPTFNQVKSTAARKLQRWTAKA